MYTIGMRGFTLVELLVSVSIFSLITGIVVYNHSKFSSDLIVTNLAYQVALSIRQAQVYGLSVRGATSALGQQTFNAGYGVHFDKVSNQSFYFFADTGNNGRLCASGNCTSSITACQPIDGCLEQITVPGGNTIDHFCIVATDAEECPLVGNPDTLDVTFKRPDPDAILKTYGPSGAASQSGSVAKIYVKSAQGKQKIISVNNGGQISIQ